MNIRPLKSGECGQIVGSKLSNRKDEGYIRGVSGSAETRRSFFIMAFLLLPFASLSPQ